MATNINPNYNPETEETNQLYNTQIPALSEDANIQEALRLYHYGVGTGLPTTNAQIQPNSIAGHLRSIRTDIQTLQSKGAGSDYSATLPTSVDDGFIWVDSTSAAAVFQDGIPTIAFYQSAEPTTGLVAGMLWVDSDNDSVYVYNGTSWDAIASGNANQNAYSEFNLTGTGIDLVGYDAVTAASIGLNTTVFGYLDDTTPIPFTVSVLSTGMSKIEIEFIFGQQSGDVADADIYVLRIINGDFASALPIAKVALGGSTIPKIKLVDSHSQAAGSVISYAISNAGADTITFDGDYIIQAIAREVA